uniref:Protein krueppel n=1 Tax=Megaselia scalaris TaxID=36166 RepID=T1GV26_MEGSC
MCRTCLKVLDLESENFHALQVYPFLLNLFNNFINPETIASCVNEAELPPNLCDDCFNKLQDISSFQKQCNETFLNFHILTQNDILIPLVKLEETFNGNSDFSDGEDKDFIDPLQTLEEDPSVALLSTNKNNKPKQKRGRKKKEKVPPPAATVPVQLPKKDPEQATTATTEATDAIPSLDIDLNNPPMEDIKEEDPGALFTNNELQIKVEQKDGGISSCEDNDNDNDAGDMTYNDNDNSQDDSGSDDNYSDKDENDDEDDEDKPRKKKAKKQPKKPTKFKCDVCPKSFYIEFRYKAHMREHMGLVPFECPHCDAGFSTFDSYKAHIKELHENVGVVYKCTEPKHADKYGNKKPFMCEECGKTFVHKSALTLHMYSHNEKEKPFPCEQCPKRFTSKSALNQHMLRHTGEKNFMCPYCGLQKYNKTDLKLHINYHTKERQWPCKYPGCTYVGNRSSAIGRHVRGVHEQIKNYQCKFCDRKFNKKETMKHHEMTHTGEKPHVCDICGWRFIQAIALKKHRETHSRSRSQGV